MPPKRTSRRAATAAASSAASEPAEQPTTRRRTRAAAAHDGASPRGSQDLGHSDPAVVEETDRRTPAPRRGTRREARRDSPESVPSADFDNAKSSADLMTPSSSQRGLLRLVQLASELQSNESNVVDFSPVESLEGPAMQAAKAHTLLNWDLPLLSEASIRLIDHVKPLQDDQASDEWQAILEQFRGRFDDARGRITNGKKRFLDSNAILRPLADREPEVLEKAQSTIRIANFTSLVLACLDVELHLDDDISALMLIDNALTNYFDDEYEDDSIDDIRALVFRMRCRLATQALNAFESEEIFPIAAFIFCNEELEDSNEAEQRLLSGPYKDLLLVDFTDHEILKQYQLVMKAVHLSLSRYKEGQDETVLASYEVEDIPFEMRQWAVTMVNDLSQQSTTRPEAAKPVKKGHPASQPEEGSDESMFVHQANAARTEPQDESESSEDEAEPIIKISGSQKPKSYFNRTASIPSSSAPPPSQLANRSVNSLPTRAKALPSVGTNGKKHPQPEDPEDSEGEEGFEIDQRSAADGRRVQNSRPIKRARPSSGQPSPYRQASSAPLPPRVRSPTLEDDRDFNENEGLVGADIVSLSQLAKKNTRVYKMGKKQRQERTPWSARDSAQLLALCDELACSWSAIAAQAKFEAYRDQTAVRDKARNLKVDFLKAHAPLPASFDLIALGKKEKDYLKALGINPDRREDDVGEDGRIRNNIWIDPDADPFEEDSG